MKEELIVVYVIVGLLALIAIPSFNRARQLSCKNVCVGTLLRIQGAKQIWFKEHSYTNIENPSMDQIFSYFNIDMKLDECPSGGIYNVGRKGENPTCTITNISYPHTL